MAKDRIESQPTQARRRLDNLLSSVSEEDLVDRNLPSGALEELMAMWNELQLENERLHRQNTALMVERERYRDLFEFAPIAYLETDRYGVIQQANYAAGLLLRAGHRSLVGKPLATYVVEEDLQRFYTGLTALVERRQSNHWVIRLKPRVASPADEVDEDDEGWWGDVFYADFAVSGIADAAGRVTALRWAIREAPREAELRERTREQNLLRRRNQELALLNRVGQDLSATLDVAETAKHLLRKVTEIIGAEGASLWLWDEEQEDHLVCRAISHAKQDIVPDTLRVRSDQGLVGWVAQNGESATIACAPADERFYVGIDEQIGVSTRSLIAVPLPAHGELLGVLEVVNKRNGDFDEDDLSVGRDPGGLGGYCAR